MAETKTKRHRWTAMSYQAVEILGVSDEGIPVVHETGDLVRGVSCMGCSAPFSAEAEHSECPGGFIDED